MSVISDSTAAHEAGHTAGLMLMGKVPAKVTVRGRSGLMTNDFTDHGAMDAPGDYLLAILLGPWSEDSHFREMEEWPPKFEQLDTKHKVGDARQVAVLVEEMGLDRVDYHAFCGMALYLCDHPRFKALHAAVSSRLRTHGILKSDELKAIKEVFDPPCNT